MMRRYKLHILGAFLLFSHSIVFNSACNAEDKLKIEGSSLFYYQSGVGDIEIKSLKPNQEFQGVALVEGGKILLSYSSADAEASTILSLYDVRQRHENVIVELGGTGGSRFSYNKSFGLVVFDWYDGLYVFSLDVVEKINNDQNALMAFEKALYLIKRCDACFEPRWVSNHIEYLQYEKNGKKTIETINLSDEILSKVK